MKKSFGEKLKSLFSMMTFMMSLQICSLKEISVQRQPLK